MAGFKTHITTSSVLGVAYGATAFVSYDVPLPACVLAGGLCGVSGMLPDLDSEPGVPLRESLAFAASVVPMLLIGRLSQAGFTPESIVLIGGALYLAIRFGLGKVLRKWTVHRGMFHSMPALAIVGELTYLISAHQDPMMRALNAGGVMLGFASHLVLDEIWSVEFRRGLHLKSSFGTAIKFWGECWWSNLTTYCLLFLVTLALLQDPTATGDLEGEDSENTIASQRHEHHSR